MTPAKFKMIVWRHYRAHGRHNLPWRETSNPYHILVSEMMLQQTQASRVVPFYNEFIKKFPTVQKLAAAPLSDVLKAWQGLGYNRRAKMLRQAAKEIVKHGMPRDVRDLEQLPGIGPYTARAVRVFAYHEDEIVIETNIRTAIIHHFFPKKKNIADADIGNVLARVLPKGRARKWYSALMDYGSSLKQSGISHNPRTKTYAKQSKFAGSLRQARGAIIRALINNSHSQEELEALFGGKRKKQILDAVNALCAEGLVYKANGRYKLANGNL